MNQKGGVERYISLDLQLDFVLFAHELLSCDFSYFKALVYIL